MGWATQSIKQAAVAHSKECPSLGCGTTTFNALTPSWELALMMNATCPGRFLARREDMELPW